MAFGLRRAVSVQLFSKISNLGDPHPLTSQTDRQTDRRTDGQTYRQTTCSRNTARCGICIAR